MFNEHYIPLARLDKSSEHKFDYTPDAQRLERIVEFLDLRKIEFRSFKGTLVAVKGGWDFNGHLSAKVTQNCVISGAPVHTDLMVDIIRKYRTDHAITQNQLELLEGFDDSIEREPTGLELDDLISESIALNIPEYPKLAKYLEKDEWSITTDNYEDDAEDQPEKPFASLKALLDQQKDTKPKN